MAAPQTATAEIDFTQPPPGEIDFTQPPPAIEKPSAVSRFGHNFLSGLGVTSDEEAKNFFEHPINTAMNMLNGQGELAKKAKDAYARGDYKGAVIHGLNYLVPFIGQQTDKAGEQLSEGDIAGGVGRTLGLGTTIAAGSPEAQSAAGSAATAVRDAVPATVRRASTAVRSLDPDVVGILSPRAGHALKLAQRAAKVANKYATGAAESATPEAVATGAEPTTPPELSTPARSLPGQIAAERIYGPRPTPAKPIPPRSGLALKGEVEVPAAEDLEGVTSPQTEAAGELAEEAAPEAAPRNAAAARKIDTSPKVVQQQLEDALGGKKLVPGVSLKNQIAAQGAAAGALPEGFTPVESSALKGYKYDPAAREFEYVTKDGSHYVRGDVDPEAAAQFEKTAADTGSFGKAWHELRNNPQGGVGQFKVLNGKRVPVVKTGPITDLAQQIKDSAEPSQAPTGKTLGNLPQAIKKSVKARSVVVDPATGRPEFSDVLEAKQPTTGAPEEDLTAQLTKSVEQAKAKEAAAASTVEEIPDNVMTMRDPGELAKRWGVDAQSLAEGREQTRGMSPAETEAQIQQLTARYKKGFAVEPVMETRDAENNLIEVDGRARAIAAQRAGVKKVPIIVRRLAAK
jgi:hypothetical protein